MDDQDKLQGAHEVKEAKIEKSTKKHRKWPWVVSILAFIFVVTPILVLGYFGFMPGISNLMGTSKAKDLGIRYNEADYISYQTKTGGQFLNYADAPNNPIDIGKKTIFADPKYMDVDLTQEEITAAINMVGWSWMPITNAQVRLNDGTVEISGNIQMNQVANFVNFINGVGYSQADVDKALGWGERLVSNPPIYVRATASVTNDVVSMQVEQAQIGRFNIPLDTANKVLNSGTNNALNGTFGLSIGSASFDDGQLHFVGTSPTKVYVKKD